MIDRAGERWCVHGMFRDSGVVCIDTYVLHTEVKFLIWDRRVRRSFLWKTIEMITAPVARVTARRTIPRTKRPIMEGSDDGEGYRWKTLTAKDGAIDVFYGLSLIHI